MSAKGSRSAQVTKRYWDHGVYRLATIRATAKVGGAYVDLAFNGVQGVEVINVWDYAAGKSELTPTTSLAKLLSEWIRTEDAEEADGDAELLKHPRRVWLKTYVENS